MYQSPKRIVYQMPDGKVWIDSPVISADDVGMTDDQALERALARVSPQATKVQVIARSEIPENRAQFATWAKTKGF